MNSRDGEGHRTLGHLDIPTYRIPGIVHAGCILGIGIFRLYGKRGRFGLSSRGSPRFDRPGKQAGRRYRGDDGFGRFGVEFPVHTLDGLAVTADFIHAPIVGGVASQRDRTELSRCLGRRSRGNFAQISVVRIGRAGVADVHLVLDQQWIDNNTVGIFGIGIHA